MHVPLMQRPCCHGPPPPLTCPGGSRDANYPWGPHKPCNMFCHQLIPSFCSLPPLTGGAQDVANFRETVAAGKLPLPSDVTFEGLCKEYYFDTSSR